MAVDSDNSIADAKETLKRTVVEHKGEWKHSDVQQALDTLVELAASERGDGEWSPTADLNLTRGRWRSITTPPFPGRIRDDEDGEHKFTLGRMSFGMFKPTKEVCAVNDIINILEPVEVEEGGEGEDAPAWTQTYSVEVKMHIQTPSDQLPAKMFTYGTCFPVSPARLGVKFWSGTLEPLFDMSDPDNGSLADLWREMFDHAIEMDIQRQSYIGRVRTWVVNGLMSMMMGLEPPVDTSQFTQKYEITRPFTGHLDILYLDEDFRVTRGNKGSIVVMERLAEEKS